MPKNKDIKPEKFPEIDWVNGKVKDNLQNVFDYVDKVAATAIDWYHDKKKWKKRWGWFLRFSAIILTAIAGLIPLLYKIEYMKTTTYSLQSVDPTTQIDAILLDPAWSAVTIALAVLAISLDKFAGYSSSWMRFMKTASNLECALQSFRTDWEIEKQKLGGTPSPTQVEAMLLIAKHALDNYCLELKNETIAWANEFQSALQQMEQSTEAIRTEIKTATSVQKYGALELKVTNSQECDGPWKAKVVDGEEKTSKGDTCAFIHLYEGGHEIEVSGTVKGNSAGANAAVIIEGGKVKTKEVTLA